VLRKAPRILFARMKGRLGHLQRPNDTFCQECTKGFAGDDLDDAAQNIGGAAVIPFRAGLADQG